MTMEYKIKKNNTTEGWCIGLISLAITPSGSNYFSRSFTITMIVHHLCSSYTHQ